MSLSIKSKPSLTVFTSGYRKSKKPVTVLITVEALNPSGQKAISFESTATLQPSSTGIDMPDEAVSEWAVRVYKLPKSFPQDKAPVELLKAAGIAFPKGAGHVAQGSKTHRAEH